MNQILLLGLMFVGGIAMAVQPSINGRPCCSDCGHPAEGEVIT